MQSSEYQDAPLSKVTAFRSNSRIVGGGGGGGTVGDAQNFTEGSGAWACVTHPLCMHSFKPL
jgi:hypothetical protein